VTLEGRTISGQRTSEDVEVDVERPIPQSPRPTQTAIGTLKSRSQEASLSSQRRTTSYQGMIASCEKAWLDFVASD
jgi:hypothetical protein